MQNREGADQYWYSNVCQWCGMMDDADVNKCSKCDHMLSAKDVIKSDEPYIGGTVPKIHQRDLPENRYDAWAQSRTPPQHKKYSWW